MNDQNEKMLFGKNVDKLINQRYQTVKQAAREIGYYRNDLTKVICGKKNFQLKTALKIAKYFNISVFLLFDRLFDVAEYRTKFHYVDEEYDEVIRVNFRELNARQSDIRIDPTTVSHFMRGHRNNPTIKTICEIADGANLSVSDLLKTVQDKELDKRIKENAK